MIFSCFRRQATLVNRTIHKRRRHTSIDSLQRLVERPIQSYISASNDPCLNLSIEHYLLQNSPPQSVVLFFYVNRSCIVIGRNQNPWLEVNLPLLAGTSNGGAIEVVRRRSGGGTVFHDTGNVNWTVISPPADFTRDKHVEMVVRALRNAGIDRARVNERHDVVTDQGSKTTTTDSNDTHITGYQSGQRSLKVSGSAYKLTKHRALHHGTCLLSSPNLAQISRYLRSPLKPYISAKGVESVSSPIDNIGLANDTFITFVRKQFDDLYCAGRRQDHITLEDGNVQVEDIRKGTDELRSLEWTFLQTPHFTITSPQTVSDGGRSLLELTVRYGVITACKLAYDADELTTSLSERLQGQALHRISSWNALIKPHEWPQPVQSQLVQLVIWLNEVLSTHAS